MRRTAQRALPPLVVLVAVLGGGPIAEASSDDAEVVRGTNIVVPRAAGKARWGRDALTRSLRQILAEATGPLLSPRAMARVQGKLRLKGRRKRTPKNLGTAARRVGAEYVLSVVIRKTGWRYTAHAIVVDRDGAVQMDFRAAYYRPSVEAADRGARIAKKTIWKLAKVLRSLRAPAGGAPLPAGDPDEDALGGRPLARLDSEAPPSTPPITPPIARTTTGGAEPAAQPPRAADSTLFADAPGDPSGGPASAAAGLFAEAPAVRLGPAPRISGDVLLQIGGPSPGSTGGGFTPTVRATVRLDVEVGADIGHDRPGEQVGTLTIGGKLEVEGDVIDGLRFFAAPWFSYVAAIDERLSDRDFLFLDVPEASVTWSGGPLLIRTGALIFAWGASDLVAPADVINPTDLRRTSTDPDAQTKIPVLAAEARLSFGPFSLTGVFQPFFTPSRFFLGGWDSSMQLGAGPIAGLPAQLMGIFDDETAEKVADTVLVTARPPDRIDSASGAARASLQLDTFDISATFFHGWETVPQLRFDPAVAELGRLMQASAATGQPIDLSDGAAAPLIDRVNQAFAGGLPLVEGTFSRRTLFGLDAVLAIDPVIAKVDVAYTPRRSLYTQDLRTVRQPWLNGVVGLEYNYGDVFQLIVEGFVIGVFDVAGADPLLYLEPAGRLAADHRTVLYGGAAGVLRYTLLDGDLRFQVAAVGTFPTKDLAVAPSARLRIDDHHQLTVGGVIVQGSDAGWGGAYDHTDQVFVQYTARL